jgi:hypothetical protein
MLVVFSMGMLTKLIGKKEIILVIVSSFIIGSLGGMFFLHPIYESMPGIMGTFESFNSENEETLYLEVSSIKLQNLKNNLSNVEGVKSFDVTGITFNLWKLTDEEVESIDSRLGNVNENYTSWNVSNNGKVDIKIKNGSDPLKTLKSFSDWFENVYGDGITYGEVNIVVVVKSSEVQNVKDILLADNIVPIETSGPVEDTINKTQSNMLDFTEFTILSGVFGIIIVIIGIYFDNVVIFYRKVKRFVYEKINKR